MDDSLEAARTALVAILDRRRIPVGVGCLTEGGMVVTCAHVVAEALGDPSSSFLFEPPDAAIDCRFVADPKMALKASVCRWLPALPEFEIPVDGRADIALLR